MEEYTLYDVTVTLLTPLHIGSGRDLLNQYDYAIHRGYTWRIDEDALLDAQEVDDPSAGSGLSPALADQLARTPPASLLLAEDFRRESSLFRYVIQGTPRSDAEGAQVQEQLKDVYDRPYLPGTSFKGALRTALAWYAWGERGIQPRRSKLGRNPKWAAQGYEKDIFGSNPNHDLLRALHVGDSEPLDAGQLMLVNASVFHRGGRAAAPIELEAVRPDAVFRLTIKLDNALFSEWARRRGLRLRGGEWLSELPAVVQSHTADRLDQEVSWFTGVRDAERVADFYRQLQQVNLPERHFLLQLGWGGGWGSKTLGSRLQEDANFKEGIIRDYRLTRGQRRSGDPFPRSRRVVMQVDRHPDGRIWERPAAPLGWVHVQMIPRTVQIEEKEEEKNQQDVTIKPSSPEPPVEPSPPPAQEPPSSEPEPEAPKAEPVFPGLKSGEHTGVVTYFNLKHGKGRILPDGSDEEVEMLADWLRHGVRYLVQDQKVTFVVVQDEDGWRLEDVGPV